MNKKSLAFISFCLFVFLALGSTVVMADQHTGTSPTGPGGQNPTGPGQQNPTGPGQSSPTGQPLTFRLDNPFGSENNTIQELFANIINKLILPIGGVLAVLAFIYSGFLYVTAAGDEKKISTAHKALLYTAVGTAILLGSWVISQVIETTINQLRN